MPSRFEKFSERARKVLAIAQEEAQRFNHSYIGTEHILLGLSREPEGIASRVLEVLGIDGKRIRTAVEFIVSQDDSPKREDVGLTDRAKKVIELAVDEARKLAKDIGFDQFEPYKSLRKYRKEWIESDEERLNIEWQ